MTILTLFRQICLVLSVCLLAACAGGADRTPGDGIFDPYEEQNRKTHEFNRSLDQAFLRPLGRGSSALPEELQSSVSNVATNLGQPAVSVNSLLQGDLRGTGISVSRFLINSTLGIAGLFDVASDLGIDDHDTDFGETLHVWGAGEGAYVELPLFGPSTTRDAVGRVVDLFTNPLRNALDDPERYYPTGVNVAAGVVARGRYADVVDSILYESADSYAQARLIYLQNRRFKLGQQDETAEIDPFELDTEGF